MKAQNKTEKDRIKIRFAAAIYKALKISELDSYRQLAKEAGMESAHIQRISTGKLDLSLTKIIAISDAFGLSFKELAGYYDSLTDTDLDNFLQALKEQKRTKGNNTRLKKSPKS
jgi:transcriptional regulator with XRE-family HTH domain